MKCLTKEEIEKIIEDSFEAGRLWAERYFKELLIVDQHDHDMICSFYKKEVFKSIGEE